jgi:hypothetical protein
VRHTSPPPTFAGDGSGLYKAAMMEVSSGPGGREWAAVQSATAPVPPQCCERIRACTPSLSHPPPSSVPRLRDIDSLTRCSTFRPLARWASRRRSTTPPPRPSFGSGAGSKSTARQATSAPAVSPSTAIFPARVPSAFSSSRPRLIWRARTTTYTQCRCSTSSVHPELMRARARARGRARGRARARARQLARVRPPALRFRRRAPHARGRWCRRHEGWFCSAPTAAVCSARTATRTFTRTCTTAPVVARSRGRAR